MQHILSARLIGLNAGSRPHVLPIEARQDGDEFVVGRTNFATGEDTVISRRHAKFKITSHAGGPEMLVVENLSMINGMLVNFRPVQPYQTVTIYNGDEICFSGAHGLTEEITLDDLPVEAQRYRYRLVMQRGVRNAQVQGNNNRKREREVGGIPDEETSRLPKRRLPPRVNVIELSSDPDTPNVTNVGVDQHTRGGSGRQISPVSVSSTEDESDRGNPFEELDDEVFEVEVPDTEEDDDLVDTSLDEDEIEIIGEKPGTQEDTTDVLPESSTTQEKSKDKGKGKAVEEQVYDLQEELECFICSSILLVPHICSPCGHGACGPCSILRSVSKLTTVSQWRNRSDSCPQCRVKLSSQEPFVRDYILERIADKYARLHLPPAEITSRDLRAMEFNQSQRQKKEDSKKSKFPTWAERARELQLPIPAAQQNYTAEDVLARQTLPPGWTDMTSAAQGHFSRWRVQVLENAGAPVTVPSQPPRPPPRPVERLGISERGRLPPRQPRPPRVQPVPRLNAAQIAREFMERHPVPPPVPQLPLPPFAPRFPQETEQAQRPVNTPAPTIDNDWLREVGQVFGGATDIQRLQMENLQVLQTQGLPRLQAVQQQLEGAQQQLQAARQLSQQRPAEEVQRQLQAVQQRTAERLTPPALPHQFRVYPESSIVDEEVEARYRRLFEQRMARRRSAPSPSNVSAAAAAGGAARNPLPS